MYRFSNGIVVYDEATRDKYIAAGMILVEDEPKKEVKEIGEEKIQSETKPNEFGTVRKRPSKFGRSIK